MATSYLKPPSCFQTIIVQSVSGSVTVNGGSVNTVSLGLSRSGWTPLGIVSLKHDKPILSCYGFGCTDNGGGSAGVWASYRNTGSSAQTATVTAYVLWREG